MASSAEIADVRENTDEPQAGDFNDPYISELIDANGVNGASAIIWQKKAAAYAKLVDVSEAGASHAFGDLQKKALDMASFYSGQADVSGTGSFGSRAAVKIIERT